MSRSTSRSGWASARSWSAPRRRISACASSSASARPSSPPATSTPKTLDELVERAVAMARAVPEDQFCGLADPALLVQGCRSTLDLDDKTEPTEAALTDMIARAEDAARAVQGRHQFRRRGGRLGPRRRSRSPPATASAAAMPARRWGISVSVLAGEGTGMERDYDFSSAVYRRRSRRPGDARPVAPASARCGGSIRARPRPRRCRSSTTRASPAAWSAISSAPSTAPRSRAAPASSRTRWASRSSPRASASSTIRTARAACAPSRSTAKASPTRSAP